MPLNLTLKLLQSHYQVVLSLREYLSQICEHCVLLQPNDMDSYQSLVTTTYVAFSEALDAPKKVTFGVEQVMSEMYEVE